MLLLGAAEFLGLPLLLGLLWTGEVCRALCRLPLTRIHLLLLPRLLQAVAGSRQEPASLPSQCQLAENTKEAAGSL